MTSTRVGRRGLDHLRSELSERDLAVVKSVDQFKFLTTRQIEQLHFNHAATTELANARAARRTLERLSSNQVLVRLDRRIGGIRAGSAAYVYGLGAVGDRLLGETETRRRFREPTIQFLDHTLAIAQLVIDLRQAAMTSQQVELLDYETEPTCWRRFQNGLSGPEVLRPDLFLAIGIGDYEHRWFIEIDRGTEATTTVVRKCHVYDDYRTAGNEHTRHGVFPRVLWITPSLRRQQLLERAVTGARKLQHDLFKVTTNDAAIGLLSGVEP